MTKANKYSGQCWSCKHRRNIPENTHIKCNKPDISMTGVSYGIENGWFVYPLNFNPIWMNKKCNNYERMEEINEKTN